MADVHDVAAAMLTRTGPESPMKLQKLLYYAQAWHLATHGRPLFPDDIEAWRDGPVIRSIWDRHKGQHHVEVWDEGDPARLMADEQAVVSLVVERYGQFSRHELSAMTHDELPWRQARTGLSDSEPCRAPLSHDVMARYFRRQVSDGETAINEATASARLEGYDVSDRCTAAMRAVADGQLSTEEAVAREIQALLRR